MGSGSKTIQEIYERISDRYAASVDQSPYNALLERPAMLDLIGSPSGLEVLDVGCASGYYSAWALSCGATGVTAFDRVAAFVEHTRARAPAARVLHINLEDPLTEIADASVDLVVMSLILHYLEDWASPLAELRRVLKPGGRLVASVSHPFEDLSSSPTGQYFRVERIEETWPSFDVTMVSYRRSLTEIFHSFRSAGFVVDDLREPEPSPAMLVAFPKVHETLSKHPVFLCIAARKSDTSE